MGRGGKGGRGGAFLELVYDLLCAAKCIYIYLL